MRRLLGLFVIGVSIAHAADLRVSNREAGTAEIGYRPADATETYFNPPSLTWLHEPPAVKYAVQWSRDADFHTAQTVTGLNFNCYTHAALLAPGGYFWRYKFTAGDGDESDWSRVRRFTVSTNAIAFPMPSAEERQRLIPSGHPRLFVRPEDLPGLRALARGREAERFEALRKSADRLLTQPPPPEPTKRGSATDKKNLEALANWWPNREQALRAGMEAETVAFVYLITGEKKYGDAARLRVLDLAGWNPDGNTNFRLNCEAAKPLLHRISRAYDWAYDVFTPDERRRVQAAVTRRIQDAWVSGEVGRGVGHINHPFNSHGNRVWHKIGESGIVFLGEIPEADLWLDYALNKFYACYPVWSDEDGGWHEGAAYWAGYMTKAVWWLQAAESALRIDGFNKPFFNQVGDFPMYVAPPNSPNAGFGDSSGLTEPGGWGGFLEYFIRAASDHSAGGHAANWQWWADQWRMKGTDGVLGFLYHAQLPPLPAAIPPTNLPPSKIFRGIGVASLHTTLLDSRDDVHFLFKSSPFGSQSHGHNPQNTFQLNAYGDALLVACTYRDYHGTEFHDQVHQTIMQNGVLVNGRGQLPHSASSRGRIADFQLTPGWDYVAGDAREAYEGRLDRALRRVLFLKPDAVIILDELAAPEPAIFSFMLHALAPFATNAAAAQFHVRQPHAGLTVQYLSPVPLSFRQWDGFEPKPIRGDFPDQWHLEAATKMSRKEMGMLTVLLPHRGAIEPGITLTRRESPTAVGVRLTSKSETILAAFRKSGVAKPAELDGIRFDSPVMVMTNHAASK